MEHISVNGEQYVKASSIARELGYTADYVGQLARSGKVDAQLVGRSWFVSERALRDHKRDRYRSTAAKSREALRESLASYTPSASRSLTQEAHFYKKAASAPSYQYEPDSHDLIPIVPEHEQTMPPEPAEEAAEDPQPVDGDVSVSTDVEESPEATEDVSEPSAEDVRIPIRAIHHPALKLRKTEHKNVRNTVSPAYEAVVAETKTAPERVVVAGRGAGGAVLVGILSAILALAAFCAFVGVEGQVVAENGSMQSSYQFNFAAAYQALLSK